MSMNTYGLFIVLAFSAAFLYVHTHAIRIGINPDRLLPHYIAAAIGGLFGARLLYVIAVDTQLFLSNPLHALLPTGGGFAFYGGVIGGALAVSALVVPQDLNFWKIADIAGPSVVLGLGVGRIGCFFAGCCHGAAAPEVEGAVALLPHELLQGQIWLSDVFPFLTTEFAPGGVTRESLLNIPLYPTQLWSVAAGLSIAAVLAFLWRHRRFDGQIAALTLIAEPPFRMLIEAFRADHRGYAITFPVSERIVSWFPGMTQAGSDLEGAVMGLTTSQFIGLGAIGLGVVIYAVRFRAGLEEEEPMAEDLLEQMI